MKPTLILLVEDDIALGAATQAILEDQAYAVSWVRDIHEAIAKLCASPKASWDLMVLDLDLNGERGETVVRVAEREGCSIPPILIVSAQPESECRVSAEEVGARAVLRKPLPEKQRIGTVQRILGDDRAA